MRIRRSMSVTAALALIALTSPLCARTIIHAGRLIDGRSDSVETEMTIVVDGDRIVEVASGYSPPGTDDSVIDLRDSTVMPGFNQTLAH